MLHKQHFLGRPIRMIRVIPFIHPFPMLLLKYTIGHEKRCIDLQARVLGLQNAQQAQDFNHIVFSEYVSLTEKLANFFD